MTEKELTRYDVIKNLIDKKINGTDASKQIGISVRQVKRLKQVVIKSGPEGLAHGGRGKIGNRKLDPDIIKKTEKLLREEYYDFGPTFASEKLNEINSITINKETVRGMMTNLGLWTIKTRKKGQPKHIWRARKDNYGEMQQFDGSYHNWFEGRNEKELEQCLLLSVDDASGKITGAKFDYNEGVIPVFKFWREYFKEKGLPLAIYLDKFSTYKINHKNAVDNKELMTQFERAMKQLGVRVIHANSPQAKGRVERMNKTLQDRLVKELRLAGIATVEEANEFLKKFIPQFNAKFAVITNRRKNLHKKLSKQIKDDLKQILSVQNTRIVNNDYTVMFKNNFFQLDKIQPTTVYKKDKVIVEEHLTGEIKLRLKNKYLNYTVLPERPKKEINIKLPALTRQKQNLYKPPIDHPWRKQFLYGKLHNQKNITISK